MVCDCGYSFDPTVRAAQERARATQERPASAQVPIPVPVRRSTRRGWHPNGIQWAVIWTAVLGGLVIAGLDGGYVAFGVAILIGALLVWQLEGKRTD
jgi:hypothetical protein